MSCFILGLIWATLPIFGWSHYSLEGVQTSCSVEWNEKNFNVLSYNVTILIAVFILPVSIIAYTNIRLILMVENIQFFIYLLILFFFRSVN